MANQKQHDPSDQKESSKRGFAGMDPKRQHEIAAEGGRASHSGSQGQAGHSAGEKQQTAQHRTAGQQENSKSAAHQAGGGTGTQGGTPAQHAAAGRQSHKNAKG